MSNRLYLSLLLPPLLLLAFCHRETCLSWLRSRFYKADQALQKALESYRQYQSNPDDDEADAVLERAINFYALAYENSNKEHDKYLAIAINYGAALDERKMRTPNHDGPSAIEVLSKPAEEFWKEETKPVLYLTALNNLGTAYLNRFLDAFNAKDLDFADRYFKRVRLCGAQPPDQDYSRSLLGSASVTRSKCEQSTPRSSDLATLEDAITQVQQVLDQHPGEFDLQCYSLLADVHDLLYRRSKKGTMDDQPPNLSNLNQAILFNEKCLSIPQGTMDEAPTRYNLAKQQFERHIRSHPSTGHDLREAEANIQRVRMLIQEEGQPLAHLVKRYDDLREDMHKHRNHRQTSEYDSAPPLRRSTLPVAHPQEITPQGQQEVSMAMTDEPADFENP